LDAKGNIYVVGQTNSKDLPVRKAFLPEPGGGYDGVLAKISDSTLTTPSPLTPTPGRLVFRYIQGDPNPAPQAANVAGPSYAVAALPSWISTATTGSGIRVSVDPTGLKPATYTGSVPLVPLAGAQAFIDVTLTVLAPAPIVTTIAPAVISTGSATTTLTVTGAGFNPNASIQLNGVALATKFIDSNTLQFTLDQSALTQPNTLSFAVINPQSAPSLPFTVTIGVPTPLFTSSSIVNAASFVGGAIAPGEIVTIFGTNLTDKVTFDNIPATLVYASATQVSITVPYSITGPSTMVQVGSSAPVKLDLAPSAPGIFAAVPAGGSVVIVYATGCGQLTTDDLPRCALPVSATVNGQPATVLYAGIAPGLVEGANQINIRVPDGITSGSVSIILTAGDASSKPFSVTLP
jgi:uncharacterized protein (TIGR03437 family)